MIEWLKQKLRAWVITRDIATLKRMQDEENSKFQQATDRLNKAIDRPHKPDKVKVINGI